MLSFNSKDEISLKNGFREFVDTELLPHAADFDANQYLPRSYFKTLAKYGYLGSAVPKKYDGKEYSYETIRHLHEELARGLPSVENAVTVCGMVCKAIARFGTNEQRKGWLPKIAAGEIIAAIAITEPSVGSDIRSIETNFVLDGQEFVLNGCKKYITMGQIADLFLVIGKHQEKAVACLVERNNPGITIKPINNLLGLRSNMLAEIIFDNYRVSKNSILGKIGYGITHVAACALDEGRYTTACGCLGIAQACLELVLNYIDKRKQGGYLISKHQLIQKMITEMIVNVDVARTYCTETGKLRDQGDVAYLSSTLMAKYFASKMVNFVANHAVQIHGAYGCLEENAIARFYRDAKIMEIIEGTSQVYETLIPEVFRV